jgi:hypothetical protein
VCLKGDANVEIQLRHNNRKTVIHANRLKPYFVAYKNLAVHPDFLPPRQLRNNGRMTSTPLPEDYTETQRLLLPPTQEVTLTQLSPAVNSPMQITVTPRRRTRNSSTSSLSSCNLHSPEDAPPAMCTRSRTHSHTSMQSTPMKSRIVLPQVTFQPLPVLQEGEGLEVDSNEIDTNEGITVNFVDRDNSWTLVQRRKKKKVKKDNKSEKWNVQQKKNFECFGDIYQAEPYKSYWNVNIGPPLAIAPMQQQVVQPPVVQPQLYPPIALPYIPPAPPAPPAQPQPAAPRLPVPLIVVSPLLRPFALDGRKRHWLEAIPEEEELVEPQHP